MWRIRWPATVSALVSAACVAQIGPTHTEAIDVARPVDPTGAWDLEMQAGAADVTVESKGDRLVHGTITYNVASLKPAITVQGRRVRIRQDAVGALPIDTRNEWRLQLGRGVPINLKVIAGASTGDWDLGGLSLRRVDWVQGAGRATLTFDAPNPERLDRLTVNGGAAALTVRGLANANLRLAVVNAGVGALTLVFDGQLSRDAEVVVNGGVSAIVIDSGGNPIQLTARGALRALANTTWSKEGGSYFSPEYAGAKGPKISIDARLGLSALQLVAGS
jgi:hypothetical protein